MSNEQNILELAEKIGQALALTEEYQQKLAAEEALRKDSEARKLVKEFQNLKNSYDRMEKMGHMLTEKNKEQLQKAEDKALANPVVKEWYDKTQKFYDMVISVNQKIQQGILS